MKRVLVTGASSGVGRELAAKMAKRGDSVVALGRNKERLSQLKSEADLHVLAVDLTENLESVVSQAELLLQGEIDILVNNAGASVSGSIEDIPISEFEKILRLNAVAPIALTKQILPGMRKRKTGLIVNVTSGVAKRGLPYESPYCLAKAALNSFSESLRVELKGSGVDLLLFSPGPIDSGFHAAKAHFGPTKLVGPAVQGRSPEEIGTHLLKAIDQRRSHVSLGMKANVMAHLNYWSPKAADRLLAKVLNWFQKISFENS